MGVPECYGVENMSDGMLWNGKPEVQKRKME